MNTKRNDVSERKIKAIAYSIYIKNKNSSFEDNSLRDWYEAEAICRNRLKYWRWYLWQFVSKYHYEIVAIVAMISLVASIGMTLKGILVDLNSVDLNTRPYVSVDMENPIRGPGPDDTFYGNNIILENKGDKLPASNVFTDYYITTDADRENRNSFRWFEENFGGFGSVNFIPAGRTAIEPGLRSLSASAEYYYFEAITSYEGVKSNKKYWTRVIKVFYVNKENKALYPVYVYGSWDKNEKFSPPVLSSKEKVVKLFEELKSKRTSNR